MEQKENSVEQELTPKSKAFLRFLRRVSPPTEEEQKDWGEVLDPLMESVKKGKISLEEYTEVMFDAIRYFRSMSETDGLTELPNRKHFDKRLTKEILMAERQGYPLSLIIGDINKLKEFNDLDKSHRSGDEVIVNTAKTLKNSVRITDIVGRYAGDEFYIILPRADEKATIQIAKKISKEMKKISPVIGKKISISLGLSQWKNSESPVTLFDRADQAAFKAKNDNKDFVVTGK